MASAWPQQNDNAFVNVLRSLRYDPNSFRHWQSLLPDVGVFKFLKRTVENEIGLKKKAQSTMLLGIFGSKVKKSTSPLSALAPSFQQIAPNLEDAGESKLVKLADRNLISLIFDSAGLGEPISDGEPIQQQSRRPSYSA